MTTKTPQIALFVDADNISAKWAKTIIAIAESYGDVVIRFICGTKKHLRGWQRGAIEEYEFKAKVAPNGKNKADILIGDESTHIAESHPEIDIFCFVTHDKHFVKPFQTLKQSGNRVICIGKKHAAESLKKVGEFVALESVKKPSPKPKIVKATTQPQKFSKLKKNDEFLQLLKKAFAHAGQEWLNLAKLGNILKKVDSTFKAKDYGNAKLKMLLKKMSEFVEFNANENKVKLKPKII